MGELTYIQRCATCHDPPLADAPSRDELANWAFGDIAASMREGGSMERMADGLSEAQIEALIHFIQTGSWRD